MFWKLFGALSFLSALPGILMDYLKILSKIGFHLQYLATFEKSFFNAVIWIRKKVKQISPPSACISYFIEIFFSKMSVIPVRGAFLFRIRLLSSKWCSTSNNMVSGFTLVLIGISGKAFSQVWLCLLDYDNSVNCQGLLWNKFFKGNLFFKTLGF